MKGKMTLINIIFLIVSIQTFSLEKDTSNLKKLLTTKIYKNEKGLDKSTKNTKSISEEVEEAYITLRINKLKNDFYQMLKVKDKKYIELHGLIEFMDLELLEMTDNRLVGILDGREIDTSFDLDTNIVYRGKVFVEIERLKEVLPLKRVTFYEETYSLSIVPKFKLPYEIAMERLEKRRNLNYSGAEKVEKKEVYKTPKKLFDLGIASLEYERYDFSRGEEILTLGYASQLLYGDFEIDGDVVEKSHLNYINLDYEGVEVLGGKDVSIGNVYLRTYSEIPIERSIEGISIYGNETYGRRDNDSIVLDGEARGAETIEVYQNGILIDYEDVEDDLYSFEVETISNDDEYTIKAYYANGRIEEKTVYVLSDSQVFPKGNWDYIVQAGRGRNYNDNQAMFNVKYGFTNNLTLGMGLSSFNGYDGEDYDLIEGNFAYRTSAWKFPSLFIGDYFYDKSDEKGTFLMNWTQKVGDYTVDIDYNDYGGKVATRKSTDRELRVSIGKSYRGLNWRARYSWEKYQDYDYKEAELDIYYRRNNYRLYGLNTYENSNAFDDLYTLELGIDFTGLKYINFNLSTTLKSDGSQSTDNDYGVRVSRRDRMGEDNHYIDLAGEVEYDGDDDEWIASLEVIYYFDDFMRMKLPLIIDTEDRHPDASISIDKAIALKDPIRLQKIKERDTFWIEGRVFRDSNGNGRLDKDEDGLGGVGINIGGREFFADEGGGFLAENLVASKDLRVSLIRETLDPTLDSAIEKIYVRGNIAEGMTYDIPLLPLSSVGGYINLSNYNRGKSFIYSKTIIEFVKDGKVRYSTSPEVDGFFIIDAILPDQYDVVITYLGNGKELVSKSPLRLDIPKNKDGDYYEVEYDLEVKNLQPSMKEKVKD